MKILVKSTTNKIDKNCKIYYSKTMKIFFERKLEKKMVNESTIKKNYGKLADKIIVRLSILEAVDCLDDIPNVPPTRRHKLSVNYSNCWAIDIDKSWRMILKPVTEYLANPKDIKEIIILDITDYH